MDSSPHDPNTSVDQPTEAEPSPLAATAVITAALAYAAYRSPQHWSATGLALTTASALVATPELIARLLEARTHPRARAMGRAASKALRLIVWLFRIAAVAVLVMLLSIFALDRSQRAAVGLLILGLAALVAAIGFSVRQARGLLRDIVAGGELDRAVRNRLGDAGIWLLAGTLFLLGTVVQLVGTFVE